ncbi:MAG: DUF2975 domain-containing protein [Desulfitobacteriaceae bacterium]|nr:DUF2975 domain-containing protein [Desulfitobacteriaceae bacterium]MDD4346935.1 DUF2975 domain-containing protein [Desulfitobacteriaceae bacterium]MDD4401151.1 DUF2975 domain-containing protein [Desulfitobacteriaceae bacterium]
MKRETLFLKIAVVLIGIPVLALCIIGLSLPASETAGYYPAYLLYPLIIGMYAAAIPFFAALYQALRLLSFIDKNKAFSELSVSVLRKIKYCAATISILYVASLPLFFLMAQADDAPGIVIIGLVITFASIVIAVFAALLQKLLKSAIDIKSENDLTI